MGDMASSDFSLPDPATHNHSACDADFDVWARYHCYDCGRLHTEPGPRLGDHRWCFEAPPGALTPDQWEDIYRNTGPLDAELMAVIVGLVEVHPGLTTRDICEHLADEGLILEEDR